MKPEIRMSVQDIYPLSPMQHAMLFHHVSSPGADPYFEQQLHTVRGGVDAGALERAWAAVIDRHAALRSSIFWEDGGDPVQMVHAGVPLEIQCHDWSGLPPAEAARAIEELVREDRKLQIDLSRAPAMRLSLLRLPGDAHRMLWTYHHVFLDGWSRSIVYRELTETYEAVTQGRAPALDPARGYREYVRWVRRQDRAAAESFWKDMLAGFAEPSATKCRRPAHQREHAIVMQRTEMPAERLTAFCRENRITLNTLVQGAWALVLSRYSGSRDVCFGVTVSGRPPELEGADSIVGLFINTLPLRVQVSRDPVGGWLQALQRRMAEVRQFEHTSLADIQGWSGLGTDRPLFESVVIFQNLRPVSPEQLLVPTGPSDVLHLGLQRGHTTFPLTLTVHPSEKLSLRLAFDQAQFDHADATGMLDHLVAVLDEMVRDAGRNAADVPVLTARELHQLIVGFNETAAGIPDVPVHSLIEAQAARTPDRTAVECGGERLSYAGLDTRAERLAAVLRARGVGAESIVGVCVPRSADMVVAILAVLKSGGAYLPLDPAYPVSRRQFMIDDSGASVLLTHSSFSGAEALESAHAIHIDGRWEDAPNANAAASAAPGDLAYVIYTSGSSGKPKGVQVTHRNVVNFLCSMRERPGMDAADTLLAVTSLSFDIAALELLLPLTVGARVVIATREEATDPERLIAAVERSGATIMQATPATWNMMLTAGWRGTPGLKALCGGERMSPQLARELLTRSGSVWNMYGPTETTIWSTVHEVAPGEELVRIGKPIANTEVYVLDGGMQPPPVNVPGELFVGGAGVARGYLNRPDLTAERFVPNPFHAGSRLYRTGDLACYLPGGGIEVIGRVDSQVKIRGVRVEPAEVEHVLAHHPGVREASVLVRMEETGEQALAAYAVLNGGAPVDGKALREYLRSQLPGQMVPAAVTVLNAMPRLPNGKIDRTALSALAPAAPERLEREAPAAVLTPVETTIAGIWSEVLGVGDIHAGTDFFDAGGHSLTAMQVLFRLRKAFGVELSIRSLFDARTVSALAGVVSRELAAGGQGARLAQEAIEA